jgi:hypothetical protein
LRTYSKGRSRYFNALFLTTLKMHNDCVSFRIHTRVARLYIFKPKIPSLVCFVGPWNRKCWYIEWPLHWNIWQPFGISYGHLDILWSFGIFFPVLVCFVKINLATLIRTCMCSVIRSYDPNIGKEKSQSSIGCKFYCLCAMLCRTINMPNVVRGGHLIKTWKSLSIPCWEFLHEVSETAEKNVFEAKKIISFFLT